MRNISLYSKYVSTLDSRKKGEFFEMVKNVAEKYNERRKKMLFNTYVWYPQIHVTKFN